MNASQFCSHDQKSHLIFHLHLESIFFLPFASSSMGPGSVITFLRHQTKYWRHSELSAAKVNVHSNSCHKFLFHRDLWDLQRLILSKWFKWLWFQKFSHITEISRTLCLLCDPTVAGAWRRPSSQVRTLSCTWHWPRTSSCHCADPHIRLPLCRRFVFLNHKGTILA